MTRYCTEVPWVSVETTVTSPSGRTPDASVTFQTWPRAASMSPAIVPWKMTRPPVVAALEDGDVVKELTCREVGVDAQLLRQIAEHALDVSAVALAADLAVANAHGAAGGMEDAGEDAHQGGLAGTVRPDEAKHAAG